jgi:hypothetical protein
MTKYSISVGPRYEADSTGILSGLVLRSIRQYQQRSSVDGRVQHVRWFDLCEVCETCESCIDSEECETCETCSGDSEECEV